MNTMIIKVAGIIIMWMVITKIMTTKRIKSKIKLRKPKKKKKKIKSHFSILPESLIFSSDDNDEDADNEDDHDK